MFLKGEEIAVLWPPVPGAHCYCRWGAVAGQREIPQDDGAVMEGFLAYR